MKGMGTQNQQRRRCSNRGRHMISQHLSCNELKLRSPIRQIPRRGTISRGFVSC
jgi:hypothetical protein